MGKQGPCYHCGVTSTPLWRNGPPDKPVLCNACGSRWRTKGSLANYTPLHARVEHDDFEDHMVSRVKRIPLKKRDEKLNKRKLRYDNTMFAGVSQGYNHSFQKNLDEDTSNRSSSGSAVSNSESCAQFGGADVSDLTGPAQSIVWDTLVPSSKRTCVSHPKPSPVEKLTRDLCTILHEQQSSHISGSSEEDLLFESETPMVSVEIGHGSILIRHPSSVTREEESEASSLSVDYKLCTANGGCSHSALPFGYKAYKGVSNFGPGIGKVKKLTGQMLQQEQVKRDKTFHERLQNVWNHNSPLRYIDLIDVVNFDVYWEHLTADEQQQLLKYLPSGDTSTPPDSLRKMFASPTFKENLSSFQQLLAEGIFDTSCSKVRTEDCKTLKRLALSNLSKSNWVEQYSMLKDNRCKDSAEGHPAASGTKHSLSNNLANSSSLCDGQKQHLPEMKTSCFSPRSLFALPSESSALVLESFHFADKSADQDLLFDVPFNGSFPRLSSFIQLQILPLSRPVLVAARNQATASARRSSYSLCLL